MNLKTSIFILFITFLVCDIGGAIRGSKRRRSYVAARALLKLRRIGINLRATGSKILRLYSLYRRFVLRTRKRGDTDDIDDINDVNPSEDESESLEKFEEMPEEE
ncbi:uncharacterized protein LOC144422027 isoform X2 [Styela clava]